jgi:hypothetical protein
MTNHRTKSAPKTGAEYLRRKAEIKRRRKQNAERQREIRADRDRRKQCRTCGAPAVVSERTGELTKQCQRHLDLDVGRKAVYILLWQCPDALQRRQFELLYPLSGALP